MSTQPSPGRLWDEAGGNSERYLKLMQEHGYIVKCECLCHADGSGHCDQCKPRLPCGWQGAGRSEDEED